MKERSASFSTHALLVEAKRMPLSFRPLRGGVLRICVVALTFTTVICIVALFGTSKFPDAVVFNNKNEYDLLSTCMAESELDRFKNLKKIFQSCKDKLKLQLNLKDMKSFNMGRYGEKKYFLPFAKGQNPKEFPCYWLTIGIGGAIVAEQEFHKVYPDCKIFGVEPGGDEQFAGFEQFGEVIQAGVGPIDGNLSMTLRDTKGTYSVHVVPVMAMHKLLDERVHSRLIHFATLDIEGYEYAILQEMMNGGVIDSHKIVFCQMDVELHDQKMQKAHMGKDFSVDDFLRTFLENSPYTPITVAPFFSHMKVTIINRASKECERLFHFSSYWKPR